MYPVYLQLREHHCVSPTEPAPCGGNPIDNDDGINNAWLPPTIEVQEGNGIVRLRDTQHLSQSIVYETFVEGKKNSHHPDTCKVCVQKQRTADLLLAEKVRQSKKKAHREEKYGRFLLACTRVDNRDVSYLSLKRTVVMNPSSKSQPVSSGIQAPAPGERWRK